MTTAVALDDRPHWVYEIWAGDLCLYVGMTSNLRRRLGEHRRTQPFWRIATDVRSVECADRRSADLLEWATIAKLRPANNFVGNPDFNPRTSWIT